MSNFREYLNEQLNESSLSRIWQHIENEKTSFGNISAHVKKLSPKENDERYEKLKEDIKNMGYGYIEMNGGFTSEYGGFNEEPSLFVPNISKKEIIELGRKYDQETIIYKGKDSFQEIKCDNKKVAMDFYKNAGIKNFESGKLKKELEKEFFSSLKKGSHRNKKFLYKGK